MGTTPIERVVRCTHLRTRGIDVFRKARRHVVEMGVTASVSRTEALAHDMVVYRSGCDSWFVVTDCNSAFAAVQSLRLERLQWHT